MYHLVSSRPSHGKQVNFSLHSDRYEKQAAVVIMGKITISFIILESIHLICLAAQTQFFELQSYGCITGTAENDEVSPSLIQCVDSCVTFTRLSTGVAVTRCTAAQYFDNTSMCRMYVYRGPNEPSVCGPKTPSLFAIDLMGRFAVHAGPLNWTAARDACYSSGRFLATITSQAEQDEANAVLSSTGFLGHYVWLGAMKTVPGGPFAWISGVPFSYAAFASGQPNIALELCLLTDGLWRDMGCEYACPYLCEY